MIPWREWLDEAHISESELSMMLSAERGQYLPKQVIKIVEQTSNSARFIVPMTQRWHFMGLYVEGTAAAASSIGFAIYNERGRVIWYDTIPPTNAAKILRVLRYSADYTFSGAGGTTETDMPMPFNHLEGGWEIRVVPLFGGQVTSILVVREYNLV